MHAVNVVGGSGFIGSRLINRLLNTKSYELNIIDKVVSCKFPEFTKICDVRSIEDLSKSIIPGGVLINLAAEHRDDVRPLTLYDEVNVGGAKNLCEVARKNKINTIIFTSSVAVYGFAQLNTDEAGAINPSNDYGRTKYEAEQIFRVWQSEAPDQRTLVIIRPTVVFGEQNRGNVYNLLHQIAYGQFVMIGNGENRKSMAYVENVAAFIEYCMSFEPGVHIYNYIDKPDLTMNNLVRTVKKVLGRSVEINFRLPFFLGYLVGRVFDYAAYITGKRFSISSIRIRKFCANSVYNSAIDGTGFIRPVLLQNAIEQTVRYEFLEAHCNETLYFGE